MNLKLLLAFVAFHLPCYGDNTLTPAIIRHLAVKVVAVEVPSDTEALDEFVAKVSATAWQCADLANVSSKGWKENFDIAAGALLKDADTAGLDVASLRKCLALVRADAEREGKAYLPVRGIWCPKKDQGGLWIVAVSWELDGDSKNGSAHEMLLGHVRAFGYDKDSLEPMGFFSCG